jgi:hypothetical protein
MRSLRLVLTAETDGRPLSESPIIRTATGPRGRGFNFLIQPDGGVTVLPFLSEITVLTGLVFTASTATTWFLNGQSGAGVDLDAGAVVCLIGARDCDGFPLWALLNPTPDACRVRGAYVGV